MLNLSHILRVTLTATAMCAALCLNAQNVPTEGTDDAEIRENPELEAPSTQAGISRSSFRRYSFLKMPSNHIIFNGADWSGLAQKFDSVAHGDGTLSILVLGDSHVQADGNSGRMRKILQENFGNAGRGLMIPFRMAGTNNPLDYRISTSTPVTTAKLMKMPWQTTMGFTGIAVHPDVSSSQFTLKAENSFNQLRIYGSGKFSVTGVTAYGSKLHYEWQETDWGGILTFEHPHTEVSISLHGSNYTIFGFDARNGHSGILLHSIGNNGATYSTYSLVGNMGRHIAALEPNLIIIALGTNEAFSKMSTATFTANMDRLVSDLRRHNPEAQILFATPMECQRSVYARRSRKGRRRRQARTYQVNHNVALMRNAILKYGQENHIAVYDFYDIAGGAGASARWLQNKLLSGDRIHRTWAGYYLEGELLSDAVLHALAEAGLKTQITTIAPTDVKAPAKIKVTTTTKKKNTTTKRRKKRKR